MVTAFATVITSVEQPLRMIIIFDLKIRSV